MRPQITALLGAAKELSALLEQQLHDLGRKQITLEREEAILAKGFIDGAIEVVEKEQR